MGADHDRALRIARLESAIRLYCVTSSVVVDTLNVTLTGPAWTAL